VVTDLAEILRLGTEKQAENLYFRRYLSAHHQRAEALQVLASRIERQIDCTACANCCRHSVVEVSRPEIDAIAHRLGIEPKEAERRYTESDPGGPALRILRSTESGCVFLEGNRCSVYEARPTACRNFPHLAPGTHSLGGRISSLCRWAALCPIVYNAIESYKQAVGFSRSRRNGQVLRPGAARRNAP
jgi:hypothetical protein